MRKKIRNKIVTFGEILMRLAPKENLRFAQANEFNVVYGGGESNVAVSLANYGLEVDFVSRLPESELGDRAISELKRKSVGVNKIVRGGERLGIYYLERGANARGSKVVYDRLNSGMATIKPGMIDWETVFSDACWFHWTGITAGLSQDAADVCLEALKIADKIGIPISADLNIRNFLWQYCDDEKRKTIISELTSYSTLLIASERDADMQYDMYPKAIDPIDEDPLIKEFDAFYSVCQQFLERYPKLKQIVTTRRGTISASHNTMRGLIYANNRIYASEIRDITHIVDRVGTGDSFMAGIIYGILTHGDDLKKAINFATAASCLKHTIGGDVNLVTVAEIEKLLNGDDSGDLQFL